MTEEKKANCLSFLGLRSYAQVLGCNSHCMMRLLIPSKHGQDQTDWETPSPTILLELWVGPYTPEWTDCTCSSSFKLAQQQLLRVRGSLRVEGVQQEWEITKISSHTPLCA